MASKQKKQQPKASDNEITKLFATALGHHQSGRLAEANAIYERILLIDPRHSDSLHLAGMVAYASGDLVKAHELIGAAVKLQPRADIYLGNFGNVLRASGRLDEAIAVYQKAIASNPKNPTPFSNLGNAYSDLGRLDEAIEQYQKALALKPDFYETLFNLALTLRSVCRFDEAIACLRKATTLFPHLAEAHYTLGQTLLLHGDLADGWGEYDWRWKLDEYKWLKDIHGEFVQPRWEGESLVGKTLLVYAEQGMGDALQFCRYLPKIVAQGAQVVFAVHPRLMRVIGPMDGVRLVPLDGVPLPAFDFHSPLLSLPRVMGTLRIEDIPGDTPYLKAESERVVRWREKLAAIPGFKIGIAWQGNPNAKIDKGRSPRLAEFAPLASVPGVTLISLQQRDGLDQLDRLPGAMRVEQLGAGIDEVGAFVDTAAIMENLDLIIVSDSAIAHLAGALGRPVWIPLKKVPDWRFLLEREDCPWYPNMKLFRQHNDGDWNGVFVRMADELKQTASAVLPAPTFAASQQAKSTDMPMVPQSWGEIIDKITILEIKSEKLSDPAKLTNVRRELQELIHVREQHFPAHAGLAELSAKLKKVNESLWWIEDDIRDCERAHDFGAKFIELARAVYVTNDQRGAVKREINDLLGSALVEEKSYAAYTEEQQAAVQSVNAMVTSKATKSGTLEKYARLDRFIETCRMRDLYPELPSDLHTQVTSQQMSWLNQRWPLSGKRVLDVGCGQGVAVERFQQFGAQATGITFGADYEACRQKGLNVREMDMSFLEFADGSFDLVWARHALEHSLAPFFTLSELHRVLAPGGRLYVEVPAPDTVAKHQDIPNHYSCLTASAWLSLFARSSFSIEESFQLNVPLAMGPDVYFAFLLGKPAHG